MKILILNYEFPPLGGGGGRVSRDLAEEWAKNGHTVGIITSHFKGLSKHNTETGIDIYRVPILGRKSVYSATTLSMLSFLFSGFFKGVGLCRRNKYDIINTYFAIPTGPLGVILSKIFKVKHFLNILGGDIYNPNYKIEPHKNFILKKVIKWVLNNSIEVIADSQDIKNKADEFYKPNKNIRVIPIGFKQFNFRKTTRPELHLDNNKFYLISVGRLIPRKRIDRIIQIISKFTDPNIELLIIGQGPEKQKLENLVSKLKIKDRVYFLGYVSEEKKYQYLSCANVFVSTSEHEGFGINFQEALSCGLPIIATNCGGISEMSTTDNIFIAANIDEFVLNIQKIKNINHDFKKTNIFNSEAIANKYLNIFRNYANRN